MILVRAEAAKSISIAAAKMPNDNKRRVTGMGRNILKIALNVAILAILAGTVLLSPAMAASDIDIQRLVQEAPDFSLYEKAQGIVWLKDHHYTLLADGSMETDICWVVLVRDTIDPSWQDWSLPAPEGGSVEIMKAEVYDPASALLIKTAEVSSQEVEGRSLYHVHFPARDEVIWVLSYKVRSPRKLGVDGYVRTGLTLPLWEQFITVDVPTGSSFSWLASENDEPALQKQAGRDRYLWHIVNRPIWRGTSLLSSFEPFIAFSMQQGEDAYYRLFQSMEGVTVPDAPASVVSMAKNANHMKAGNEIIQYVKNQPSFPDFVADNLLRTVIPEKGAWSDWEKTIILARWLPIAGWQVNLKWVTAADIAKDTPVTRGFLLKPILEASIPGSGTFYFDIRQGLSLGNTPPSLWGSRICGIVDRKLTSDVIQGGGAADHRLSLRWNLNLDESGYLSGHASFLLRNGWAGLFFGGKTPDISTAASILSNSTGLQFDSGQGEIKKLKYGYEIIFPVKVFGAITGASGKQMLVKLPTFTPRCLKELVTVRSPFSVQFPFAVEMEYDLRIPDSMSVLALPGTSGKDMGKVKYYENLTYKKKKHTVNGSARVVVSVDRFDGSLASALSESLRRFADFNTKTLPLRAK